MFFATSCLSSSLMIVALVIIDWISGIDVSDAVAENERLCVVLVRSLAIRIIGSRNPRVSI